MSAVLFFLISIIMGMPIAFALGGAGTVHALLIDDPNIMVMLPQRMFAAADNFSLMAIPLFVLAGELMGFGGITEKLADFTRALIGHIRGGLAYVTVIVGCFLGALLGSANASAALLGSVMQPEMKKDGYDETFATSLTAAVAILGPIIPPSMVFIVYGVAANLSIGELFFAGIIPGLILAAGYMVLIYYVVRSGGDVLYGHKLKFPVRPRSSLGTVARATLSAAPTFIVPVIILGGILGGITTPTESAAAASVAAIFLGTVVYRKLKLSHLPQILGRTGVISAAIMIIVAMANILGYTLALEQVPQAIAEFILGLTRDKYVFLLLVNIFLLFVGMVMETVAAIIILVPVFLPIITTLGIDPLHFGLIVCFNLIIGLLTPPVGVVLFTTSIVTGTPLQKLLRPIWSWVGVGVAVLLLLTYFPDVVTFLPKMVFRH